MRSVQEVTVEAYSERCIVEIRTVRGVQPRGIRSKRCTVERHMVRGVHVQ